MASKKAVLVYILEILKSETDANHTLSQEEIRSILAERYEVSVDRKTLGRHLNDLYAVSYTHLHRHYSVVSEWEKNYNKNFWLYNRLPLDKKIKAITVVQTD